MGAIIVAEDSMKKLLKDTLPSANRKQRKIKSNMVQVKRKKVGLWGIGSIEIVSFFECLMKLVQIILNKLLQDFKLFFMFKRIVSSTISRSTV